MVAHRPRMIVVPRNEQALGQRHEHEARRRRAAEADRLRDDPADDRQGRPDLRLGRRQDALEVRDADADQDRSRRAATPSSSSRPPPKKTVAFDDAVAERVDPFDFMWDPLRRLDETRRVGHPPAVARRAPSSRGWSRPASGARRRTTPSASGRCEDLLDRVRAPPSARRSGTSAWRPRATRTRPERATALHEVWEFHDGQQVITVLDDAYPVQAGPNPSGEARIPFQIYRPDRRRRPLRRHL